MTTSFCSRVFKLVFKDIAQSWNDGLVRYRLIVGIIAPHFFENNNRNAVTLNSERCISETIDNSFAPARITTKNYSLPICVFCFDDIPHPQEHQRESFVLTSRDVASFSDFVTFVGLIGVTWLVYVWLFLVRSLHAIIVVQHAWPRTLDDLKENFSNECRPGRQNEEHAFRSD